VIRTVYFRCDLPKSTADALNVESGRIYSQVLVEQYRLYRKRGQWLSGGAAEKLNDFYNREQPSFLHAHSIDAAQQGFFKAYKTTRAARKVGVARTKYPYKCKYFRSTVWKNSGIRKDGDSLLLSLARGYEAIRVVLPTPLHELAAEVFSEMRLIYNPSARYYEWHLVVDDGLEAKPLEVGSIAAGDLGEIHPITLTDGAEATVISCRELRSVKQYTHKRLAELRSQQDHLKRGSRRWRRIQKRKNQFLAKQALRRRDIEHRISRYAVDWCIEHQVKQLVLGDVRDIADGKRLNKLNQQKISSWSHGKLREYIGYKAEAHGLSIKDDVNEAYTSQTCPSCGHRHKPQGRTYVCANLACGAVAHRDVVGAVNILSRFVYNELAKVPAVEPKYRHPIKRGKRSPVVTRQVARFGENRQTDGCEREAALLQG
jgi:putative transposase